MNQSKSSITRDFLAKCFVQDQTGFVEHQQDPVLRTPISASPPTSINGETGDDQASDCTCLQQNTELLCSFKLAEAMNNQNSHRIDTILQAAQEATKPWQNLLDCRNCGFNQDQEVIQIAFMTIRILLLRFQDLVPLCDSYASSREGHSDRPQCRQEVAQRAWQKYGVRLTLGAYEVSESESSMMVQVLLLGAIRNIKSMLLPFKEMLDRKQRMHRPKLDGPGGSRGQRQAKNAFMGQGHPASNIDHIKHMLQGLGSFLQTLERTIDRDHLDRNFSTS